MNTKTIRLVALIAVSTIATDLGLSQTSGARNQALGGTGVASSNPQTAAFVNPAMIRHGAGDQGLSVVVPFVGAFAADQGDFADKVDDLQGSIDVVKAFLNAGDLVSADALRPTIASQLQALNGSSVDVLASGGVGVVVPFEGLTVAVSARSYVDARAITFVDPDDLNTIATSVDPDDFDDLQSPAFAAAAGVAEFGVSLATELEVLGRDLTIGVTPKAQAVETYNYAVSVSTFDGDDALNDFGDDQYRDSESGFNVDVGAAMDVTSGLTAALSVQNLMSDTYRTVITAGRQFSYKVEPRPVLGLAYSSGGLTLTGDVELLATTRFEEIPDSQFVRAGVEYDLVGWAQLRAGLALDLEETQSDILSAGLGLSPFETLRVDLVGQLSENGGGAGVQLALTF
ncbi:MAG: conjugal transfer protein TraF [Planctomycetota bacterium]|nr:conjugal transfer protein TraF [Planctomycetota bacterium]